MKSSTVRRSALSKESINVIENLSNEEENYSYNNSQPSDYPNYDGIPNEYVRPSDNYDKVDSKSKEIDMLWQSFKTAQLSSNSTFMHVMGGFIAGVVSTFIILALFGVFATNNNQKFIDKTLTEVEETVDGDENMAVEDNTIIEDRKPTADELKTEKEVKEIIKRVKNEKAEDTEKAEKHVKGEETEHEVSEPAKTKRYVIKEGDTVEAIIRHEYGAYTPERAEAVMKANNLSNLDRISIDQVLLLPVEK